MSIWSSIQDGLNTLTNSLSTSDKKSGGGKKGKVATRRMCIGEITHDTVWFESCSPDASDFRLQYGIPKRHYKYSEDELELLQSLDEGDRNVYEVTLECGNQKGTLWLLKSMEKVDELPSGYRKNALSI